MLITIDEFAEDLDHEQIDFVAGLIDGKRKGRLTYQNMCQLRALLRYVPLQQRSVCPHR